MNVRIGFGYDVHQLKEGKEFVLGGIKISHNKGIVAHSDGDVLIHSLCDAILGAANMRDIGFHFPDSSDEFKGIDSKILLKKTIQLITAKGFSVINTDSTVCLQQPKIQHMIPSMQKVLGEIMQISSDDISIKATTNEKLGFIGREEGISVYSVCLLAKNETF